MSVGLSCITESLELAVGRLSLCVHGAVETGAGAGSGAGLTSEHDERAIRSCYWTRSFRQTTTCYLDAALLQNKGITIMLDARTLPQTTGGW